MIGAIDIALRVVAGIEPATVHVIDARGMCRVVAFDERARLMLDILVAEKRDAVTRHLMRLLPAGYSVHVIDDTLTEVVSWRSAIGHTD